MSFEEAVNLLKSLNYKEKTTGSHHVFRKPGHQPITIKRRNPIHRDAVKDLKKALEQEDT